MLTEVLPFGGHMFIKRVKAVSHHPDLERFKKSTICVPTRKS